MTQIFELAHLIEQSRQAVEAMTSEQRAAMLRAQRRSLVRAEAGFGTDADEAVYQAALATGNEDLLSRLKLEAEARILQADARMDEAGF